MLIIVSFLGGCTSEQLEHVEAEKPTRFKVFSEEEVISGNFLDMMIVEDSETGCKYVINDISGNTCGNFGGITLLLKSNGMPDCKK